MKAKIYISKHYARYQVQPCLDVEPDGQARYVTGAHYVESLQAALDEAERVRATYIPSAEIECLGEALEEQEALRS